MMFIVMMTVMDRMKPVSLESFRDHVVSKHNERDKGFESEYQVCTYWYVVFIGRPVYECM